MTAKYVERKHGKKWQKKHPIYEEVTEDTYSIIIYQEQIMQVISKVAGLSESVANKIRKVIAKKRDAKQLDEYWEIFKNGCKKMETFSQKEAEDFWEELKNHAHYSFNRAHSVEYALIAYWTAFLKTHCKKEFYTASLTYGEWNEKSRDNNKHKNSLLFEIRQNNFSIMPPKRKHSDATNWRFHKNILYAPFIEILGVGEGNAKKYLIPKKINQNKLKGFFGAKYTPAAKTISKVDQILKDLKVDDFEAMPPMKALKKYLPDIDFKKKKIEKYPNLIKAIGDDINENDLNDFLTLNIIPGKLPNHTIQRKRFRIEKPIYQCNRCSLRKQVKKRPVLSSTGLYNIMILLEAPGVQEDKECKMAVGKSGQILWRELSKYNYNRRFFHLTNACHCWPSQTKTPSYREIDSCYKWLKQELEQLECRLILACGNTPLYALTEKKGGIVELNGTTEWIENINAWVCWCVHPSSVLRDEKINLELFQNGIKKFTQKMEILL